MAAESNGEQERRTELLQKISELSKEKAEKQELIKTHEGVIADCLLAHSSAKEVRYNKDMIKKLKQAVARIDMALASTRASVDKLDAAAESTTAAAGSTTGTVPETTVAERKRIHRAAYKKIIKEKSTINICPVRFNYMGLPRSGKTSFRHRLLGDFLNIMLAKLGVQPSTGVAELGGQVIIRTMTSDIGTIQCKAWSVLKGLLEEANMLSQFFYQTATSTDFLEDEASSLNTNEASTMPDTPVGGASASSKHSKVHNFFSLLKKKLSKGSSKKDKDMDEMFSIIGEAMEEDKWDAVKYILEDIILLINTDTGGQAEFLDLHASLVQGPSFNLLFSRLVDQLDSQFKVYYTNEDGVSTEEEDSTMTVREVLFQALSSIACFSGCFSGGISAPSEGAHKLATYSKSKVMFVGTHRDQVTETEFREKDKLLQSKIKSTEFYDKDIVEFASEDQLMLAVNNMTGDQGEIDGIRRILEKVIEKNFEKIPIPAAWLMLSLYIRKKGYRTMTLSECEKLASKLGIGPKELQDALWFLHHCIGVLLYYPEVESLKATVICEIQVLFDSATNLIRNTFTFDKVGKAASDKFKEKAQFSLAVVKEALSHHTDDLIPLEKLVELLEHLNILTAVLTVRVDGTRERSFFMPCILRSARASELSVDIKASDPAPLMLRFECGYVPVGVFPAMITNLVSQKLEDWVIIDEDLRKNRVRFYVGEECDTITLLSHPQYFEIVISRNENSEAPVESVCAHVRDIVQSTLSTVTSRMNYHFSMGYQFGFECPTHPGREHLCVLTKENAKHMWCLQNPKKKLPVPLKDRHKLWFSDHAISRAPLLLAPLLKNLMLIKWNDKQGHKQVFRLVDQVSSKWRKFGLLLNLTNDQLDSWNTQYHCDSTLCWEKVMQCWLDGGSEEYPVSWEGLYSLLEGTGYQRVARELEVAMKNCC